ncbi:MAG: sulfite exporter TauE/SafE family protein [Gammaproteobacteria bacterium]|nr:sulfite exporter TauE/SafE family protein [Gammaproteobacteria bacterium]
MLEAIVFGFIMGLSGSLHCIGMCGAIITSFSLNQRGLSFTRSFFNTIAYNLGRILTYVLLGVLIGLLGELGTQLGLLKFLRILAASIMIVTGLYLLGLFPGFTKIEIAGKYIWRRVQPLTKRLDPNKSYVQGLLTGMIWGLIPCGLVYAAVGVALSLENINSSAIFMLFFGIGTMLPLVLMGIGFTHMAKFLKRPVMRYILAFSLFAIGSYSLYTAIKHQQHEHHSNQNIESVEKQSSDNSDNAHDKHEHKH